MCGPMQKDLERAMAAKSQAVWVPGHRSGKLHNAALIRGMFGHDDLFRRKHVSRSKDVAVELVVDCSGSMSGYGKIATACYAAYALASTLERIGIANEVIGFTTRAMSRATLNAMMEEAKALGDARVRYARAEALHIPVFKAFGERVGPVVKRRFAEVAVGNDTGVSMCSNVDGESIQIASRRVLARREARKVMIVLSDGRPAASGDFAALHQHLKDSVKLAEKRGVETVGIGIMDDSVKQFYPKHVVLKDVAQLPTEVMGQLKKFLI